MPGYDTVAEVDTQVVTAREIATMPAFCRSDAARDIRGSTVVVDLGSRVPSCATQLDYSTLSTA